MRTVENITNSTYKQTCIALKVEIDDNYYLSFLEDIFDQNYEPDIVLNYIYYNTSKEFLKSQEMFSEYIDYL